MLEQRTLRKMLPALSAIASEQSAPTEKTRKKIEQLMDYVYSDSDVIVIYKARNMALAIHSNTLYLSKPCARSRAGGYFMSTDREQPGARSCAPCHPWRAKLGLEQCS